jgi:biotin synthase
MKRRDWTIEELQELYASPLLPLVAQAHRVHQEFHKVGEVQVCSLISIKTGGCPENCKYCAQSASYKTPIAAQPLMQREEVLELARQAKARGATRVCLGAAFRQVRDNKQFEEILEMVSAVAALGVEVCVTLGMLKEHQARRLKEAGLYAYNHNLDSSERFYPSFVTTRTYQDRLDTLDVVEKSGLNVCCGGIIGMGEEPLDRLQLILELSKRNPHPQSVPINQLSRIPGTPLADGPKLAFWDVLRMVAIARIAMPRAMIRLSAGRIEMSFTEQALCFFAGANSLFAGEKLLTVANTPIDRDAEMFEILGLKYGNGTALS